MGLRQWDWKEESDILVKGGKDAFLEQLTEAEKYG